MDQAPDLRVTPAARAALRALLGEKGLAPDLAVRVSPGALGAPGTSWVFTFDAQPGGDEVLLEADGVRLVLGAEVREHLRGHTLDYLDDLLNRGFVFRGEDDAVPV